MKNSLIGFSVLYILFFSACKKQEQNQTDPAEENELITAVKLTFIDSLSTDTVRCKWSQKGGPGTLISVDTIHLKADKTYKGFLEIYDESKIPVYDLTPEIKFLQNEHRFVYSNTSQGLSIQIADFDAHVPPIELGLIFRAITTSNVVNAGNFRIMLKHYTASSPKTTGINAGSTDMDVSFPMIILP